MHSCRFVSDFAILTSRLSADNLRPVRRPRFSGVENNENPDERKGQMIATKVNTSRGGVIPLMAALPYAVTVEAADAEASFSYDPIRQLTMVVSSRGYSTCQYEESV